MFDPVENDPPLGKVIDKAGEFCLLKNRYAAIFTHLN
jgi:hypothetical protein